MGFEGSTDIFQAQMIDLMASLEHVWGYIDDLLIIARGVLDDHLFKIETVLARLHDAGLKVNAAKSLFCTHKIEYLGYILTREGIIPQPKKVQAVPRSTRLTMWRINSLTAMVAHEEPLFTLAM